jgi:hypothetical protein
VIVTAAPETAAPDVSDIWPTMLPYNTCAPALHGVKMMKTANLSRTAERLTCPSPRLTSKRLRRILLRSRACKCAKDSQVEAPNQPDSSQATG